jgi:hypothetical protein
MTNVLAYIGRNTYELYRYFAGLYEMTAKAVYWAGAETRWQEPFYLLGDLWRLCVSA